ncbi:MULTISPECIES: ABC transporter substrate-binding protein [Roseomonadaceae]|uniref:ABC transporter substrate-binding protein n=1 Tax=Falsiroseomonas oleicola TaxID=2801474 RepID=A0ABS6H550_9PROT|nr:ABC transporter substrate-binding protein [Roseomonas oleicola]MBU8543516.1 ABC transporter substrate-binding protein [Roseomonas oleicola]
MRLHLLFNHEPISLAPNTHEGDSSSATVILKLACPSLLRLDPAMRPQPDLAESWRVSDGHRIFDFTLRPGLTFHNGRALEAEAAAACFHRIFDPRVQSPLQGDFAGLEAVEATGRLTLRFRFAEPHLAFLPALAWRCFLADDVAVQPVGAGPYEVLEWRRGSHLRLRKFPGHYAAHRFAAEELVIRFAPRAADRIAAIEAGAADIIETLPAGAAADLVARGLVQALVANSPRKTVIAFRTTEPPFDDPRMRQAVAHALDLEAIRARHLGDRGRLVVGVLPEDDPWAEKLEPLPFDPDRARALVREAGHGDGVRVQVSTTAMPPVPGVAAQVAAGLAAIGIELDLRHYWDPPWWPAVYLQGGWQMAIQGASARPHPHILFQRDLCTGGAFNAGGYSNPRLDTLVAEARRSADPARQRETYAEAQRLVHAELPVLPLYAADVLAGARPGLRGFRPHPLGYVELEDVRLRETGEDAAAFP